MPETVWTLASLTPDQEQLVKEAEATLGDGVILAYQKMPAALSELSESQRECLEALEKKLGVALVAVKPS